MGTSCKAAPNQLTIIVQFSYLDINIGCKALWTHYDQTYMVSAIHL
jgi:hypothetical protein